MKKYEKLFAVAYFKAQPFLAKNDEFSKNAFFDFQILL